MQVELTEMTTPFSGSLTEPCYQVRYVNAQGEAHVAIFVGPDAKAHATGHANYLSGLK